MKRGRRYRRAMSRAIDMAAGRPDPSPYIHACSRAAGLRVIREFEKVNEVFFDPFDDRHVSAVRGMARFLAVIRAWRADIRTPGGG